MADEPHVLRPAAATDDDAPASGGRLLLGWILIAVAVVLLFAGWLGVSGTPKVERQMAYLVSGGIGGLLAGIAGMGFLLSDDVRRDRERLGRVEAAVLEVRELLAAQSEVLSSLEADAHGVNGSAAEATGRRSGSSRKA